MEPSTEANEKTPRSRRPLIVNEHKKRSVNTWVIPLLIIIAVMFFLPRVMEKLG